MNLPTSAYKRGDQHINFLEYRENTTVTLTLECRCSVYRPTWNHYKMATMNELPPSNDTVHCIKNGSSCQSAIISLEDKDAPNYYLYQTTTFVITEPSVLMCSSWRKKEIVIVSLKQPGILITHTLYTALMQLPILSSSIYYYSSCIYTAHNSCMHPTHEVYLNSQYAAV